MELNEIRELLSWASLLQIFALIYAGIEFMSNNQTLKFLFRKSTFPRNTIFTIILVVLLNLFADLSPMIRQQTIVTIPLQLPEFVLNGLLFKASAILFIGALIIDYFLITLFPGKLLKQLKYNEKNPEKFFNVLFGLLKYTTPVNSDNYRLVRNLLFDSENFKKILQHLKNWQPKEERSETYRFADEIVNYLLTDQGFLSYLASEDKFALLKILTLIKDEDAKQCHHFIRKLSARLLCKQSFLDPELKELGDGAYRDIMEIFYEQSFFYKKYLLFDVDYEEKDAMPSVIEKLTRVLELGIKDYFSQEANQSTNRITNPFHSGMEFLSQRMREILYESDKLHDVYDNKYQVERHRIIAFFSHLKYSLFSGENRKVKLSEEEMEVSSDTVTGDIVNNIFEVLSNTAMLDSKDGQDIARMIALQLDWVWDNKHELDKELFRELSNKMITLLDERVEENLKGGYPPVVRVLLSISGISKKGQLGKMLKKYEKEIVRQMLHSKTKKTVMPMDWKVSKDNKRFYNENGVLRVGNEVKKKIET